MAFLHAWSILIYGHQIYCGQKTLTVKQVKICVPSSIGKLSMRA
uniref:Uncharacterized protein n=1 Tax=Globodera pallida TaxID=36090 RepID=A0A183CRN1_GLOPA